MPDDRRTLTQDWLEKQQGHKLYGNMRSWGSIAVSLVLIAVMLDFGVVFHCRRINRHKTKEAQRRKKLEEVAAAVVARDRRRRQGLERPSAGSQAASLAASVQFQGRS